jgi:hypothetical protein
MNALPNQRRELPNSFWLTDDPTDAPVVNMEQVLARGRMKTREAAVAEIVSNPQTAPLVSDDLLDAPALSNTQFAETPIPEMQKPEDFETLFEIDLTTEKVLPESTPDLAAAVAAEVELEASAPQLVLPEPETIGFTHMESDWFSEPITNVETGTWFQSEAQATVEEPKAVKGWMSRFASAVKRALTPPAVSRKTKLAFGAMLAAAGAAVSVSPGWTNGGDAHAKANVAASTPNLNFYAPQVHEAQVTDAELDAIQFKTPEVPAPRFISEVPGLNAPAFITHAVQKSYSPGTPESAIFAEVNAQNAEIMTDTALYQKTLTKLAKWGGWEDVLKSANERGITNLSQLMNVVDELRGEAAADRFEAEILVDQLSHTDNTKLVKLAMQA